jgi:predicted glycosyltransferase
MRVVYYVQGSKGLGHAFRAQKILAHLATIAPRWKLFALTDSEPMLAISAGRDFTALPLLGRLRAHPSPERHAETICRYLVDDLQAEVLVASHWRCLARELRPVVPRLRKLGIKLVVALRDVIGQPLFERELTDAYGMSLEEFSANFVDGIAIFGNRELHSITSESPVFLAADKIHYCGFVPPLSSQVPRLSGRIVQCVVGGGAESEFMLEALLKAVPVFSAAYQIDQIRFVTGPYCKVDTISKLCGESLNDQKLFVSSFDPDWYARLPQDALVVSTGAYNVVTEALFHGYRSICVPHGSPTTDVEQELRARSISTVGSIKTLMPAELTTDSITARMGELFAMPTRSADTLFNAGGNFKALLQSVCE